MFYKKRIVALEKELSDTRVMAYTCQQKLEMVMRVLYKGKDYMDHLGLIEDHDKLKSIVAELTDYVYKD